MNPVGAVALMVVRLALLGIAGRQLLIALDTPHGRRRVQRIVFASAIVACSVIQL